MATAKKKTTNGLGRGLGSILTDVNIDMAMASSGVTSTVTTAITTIPIDKIETNPFQPRKEFDEQALKELSISIEKQGVITPITVRRMPNDNYQLIAGERRYRASKMAGLKEIPAYIRVATDSQMMEMALVENIQRAELNAMEIAFSYKALIEECKLTHEDLSSRVGKDRSTITNYLRLLNLPSKTQEALFKSEISMAHARCLVNIEDIDKHLGLLSEIIDKQLSVRQTELRIKELTAPEKPTPKKKVAELPSRHAAEKSNLKQYLQSEIEIKRSRRGKGTLTIHFNNDADFERIVAIINKK